MVGCTICTRTAEYARRLRVLRPESRKRSLRRVRSGIAYVDSVSETGQIDVFIDIVRAKVRRVQMSWTQHFGRV